MKLSVVSCNPSNEGKTYVVKAQGNKSVKVMGVEKVSTMTYYISLPSAVGVGEEFDVDMSLFNIIEHPFEHPVSGETIQLKWLHIK